MSVVPMCLCLTLSDAYVIRLDLTSVKHFPNVMFVRTVDDVREAELAQYHTAGITALPTATIQEYRTIFFDVCQLFRNMTGHEFGRWNVDRTIDMTRFIFEWFAGVYDKLLHYYI